MATRIDVPGPPETSLGGHGDWVELASDLTATQAARIRRALTEAGIGSRSRAEDGVITILVLRAQLEEARFVLATVSFAEPATLNAPLAETGRARWSSPVKRAASVVVAALLLTSIFLLAPRDTKEPARCPGGETTHLIAPWAGCDAPKDEVAPGDG